MAWSRQNLLKVVKVQISKMSASLNVRVCVCVCVCVHARVRRVAERVHVRVVDIVVMNVCGSTKDLHAYASDSVHLEVCTILSGGNKQATPNELQ